MLKRKMYQRHITSGSLSALLNFSSEIPLKDIKDKLDAWYEQYGDEAWFQYHPAYESDDSASWILYFNEQENETIYQRRVDAYNASKPKREKKRKGMAEQLKATRRALFEKLSKEFGKDS